MLEKDWFRQIVLFYLRNAPWSFGKEYFMHGVIGHSPNQVWYRNRDGIFFDLELNDYVQKRIYCFDYFEHRYIKFAKKFIKKEDVIFDIGAHVGQFAFMAAKRVGLYGNVYAFEPNPVTFQSLKKNHKMQFSENRC